MMRCILVTVLFLAAANGGYAQVPPSAAEAARYQGLLAAAE